METGASDRNELASEANWRVHYKDTETGESGIARLDSNRKIAVGQRGVTIPINDKSLGIHHDHKLMFSVGFKDTYPKDCSESDEDGWFKATKGKEDSDLYLFGSYLAGQGTKPIFVIDAKVKWLPEIKETGFFLGPAFTLSSNTQSSDPPNDRTRADPDSITGSLEIDKWLGNAGVKLSFQAVEGEFSRKYPESNLVTAGRAQLVKWECVSKIECAFEPFIGYELGHNLNHPSTILGQPANLSNYGAIERFVFGTLAAIYTRSKDSDPDNPHPFAFTLTYTGRLPFAAEPFVTGGYDASGTHIAVTSLRRNTKHYVEGDALWNVTKLFGVEMNYKYGAQPPLFELVGNQVSFGLTFKAAFNK